MSRYIPDHANAAAVLAAAARWREDCLVEDRSALSGRNLWTPANLAEVDALFNGAPDASNASFQVKLRRQFAAASPAASQLVAELLWAMNLFPSNIGSDKKLELIREAWSWSGEALDPAHPHLDSELMRGVGSAGPGYLAHRPRELRFMIAAMRELKAIHPVARSAMLADPWAFADWLTSVPDPGYRQLRHILPFLLFPDHFERIASPGDIRRILQGLDGATRDELRPSSKVELDRRVLRLRERLEYERGGPIDFYEPFLKRVWAPSEEVGDAAPVALMGIAATSGGAPPLNQILFGPPGTGKTYRTIDKTLAILDPEFALANAGDRDALKWRFDELVGEGRARFVTFHQSFSYEDFVEGLRAETSASGAIAYRVADGVLKGFCAASTPSRIAVGARFASGYEVIESTAELLWLRKPNGARLPLAWAMLDELDARIEAGEITIDDVRKGQVFERVRDSDLEKYLVNGYNNVLPHILEAMRATPRPVEGPRVLIIDEINRGNVSRVFGELITLIEPSKRAGAREALSVTLPYSKTPFSLPGDLHFIGTMNTADRSLASLDFALRRRFVFEEIEPDPATLEGVVVAGVELDRLLETMNARIEALLDREHRMGHAYFLGLEAGDDVAPLASLFENRVLPLLQEYFFDDWRRVRLVLNDHRKLDPADQFIIEAPRGSAALFGDQEIELPTRPTWRINPAAFARPSAYRAILT